jgi:hypothetical protein
MASPAVGVRSANLPLSSKISNRDISIGNALKSFPSNKERNSNREETVNFR